MSELFESSSGTSWKTSVTKGLSLWIYDSFRGTSAKANLLSCCCWIMLCIGLKVVTEGSLSASGMAFLTSRIMMVFILLYRV